ncbi:hypothetical protein HanIR_Chr01g0000371 [Helianthus annuus]|nr:hypothetical protein HanIR_Chr01g0000371 [Helianthus annuus]
MLGNEDFGRQFMLWRIIISKNVLFSTCRFMVGWIYVKLKSFYLFNKLVGDPRVAAV